MHALNADLQAKDVMVAEPICVEPSMTIRQLARVLAEHEISGAPVVDKDGRVIGVVSRSDLIRHCSENSVDVHAARGFDVLSEESRSDKEIIPESLVCVEDFMTPDPVTATPNTPACLVARLMSEKRIHRVVIVDHDKFPVGIVTSLDLLSVYPQEDAS